MTPEEALRQRNIVAAGRWRWIFGALAVVIPLVFGLLFQRQNNRLRALSEHGQPTTAIITQITRQGSATYSHYQYEVGGTPYDWSVTRQDAPFAPGESFPITYLPEHPSLSRPGESYSHARFEAEVDLTFQHRFLFGFFAAFALGALWCERTVRRLRAGGSWTGARISPDAAGRAIAGLLLIVAVATNFDRKVIAVQTAAFGGTPVGLPVTLVVSLAEAVLFVPFFWVFPHLIRIVVDAQSRGQGLSKAGVLLSVARAGPEFHRSRNIVIAGFVYFVALMGAWIAFAASRGV